MVQMTSNPNNGVPFAWSTISITKYPQQLQNDGIFRTNFWFNTTWPGLNRRDFAYNIS